MGDFVKGKAYLSYPDPIKNGILIHRAIDHFTDRNLIAKKLVAKLKPLYRRYAGVVSDIVFDHILAKNFQSYTAMELDYFAGFSYKVLSENKEYLPERVAFILDRIKSSKRLQMYESLDGIRNSVEIMSNHTSLPDRSGELIKFIDKEEPFITDVFEAFYPELEKKVVSARSRLS